MNTAAFRCEILVPLGGKYIRLFHLPRYDAKVRRIKDSIGLPHDMSWLGLDKWEIPREHVVLNRKLGEGAFGTVYGGEALINNVWLAVAVKTLKIGSNAEEKVRL